MTCMPRPCHKLSHLFRFLPPAGRCHTLWTAHKKFAKETTGILILNIEINCCFTGTFLTEIRCCYIRTSDNLQVVIIQNCLANEPFKY